MFSLIIFNVLLSNVNSFLYFIIQLSYFCNKSIGVRVNFFVVSIAVDSKPE